MIFVSLNFFIDDFLHGKILIFHKNGFFHKTFRNLKSFFLILKSSFHITQSFLNVTPKFWGLFYKATLDVNVATFDTQVSIATFLYFIKRVWHWNFDVGLTSTFGDIDIQMSRSCFIKRMSNDTRLTLECEMSTFGDRA